MLTKLVKINHDFVGAESILTFFKVGQQDQPFFYRSWENINHFVEAGTVSIMLMKLAKLSTNVSKLVLKIYHFVEAGPKIDHLEQHRN